MTAPGARKNALEEFLPESIFKHGEADLYVSPEEVRLDPIDALAQSEASANSVQIWPMLAAALVAIGVSMLAMAAFARFGFSTL